MAALLPLAINEWRRFDETRARDRQVLAHRAAAEKALVDGRPEHALVALEAARRLAPLDLEVQGALREAHVRVLVDAPQRLPIDAAVAAAHAIQQALPLLRGAEAARHHVALGNLASLTGHDPLPWYEQALAADPASLAAHLHMGLTLLGEGATEVAEVLRDLSVIKMGKALSFGERKMLDMAKTLLVKEICIATGDDEAAVEAKLDAIFAVEADEEAEEDVDAMAEKAASE